MNLGDFISLNTLNSKEKEKQRKEEDGAVGLIVGDR
jgi:hypothetical protein